MNREATDSALLPELQALMAAVSRGVLAPGEAAELARALLVHDLGYAQVDLHRMHRRGRPEAIFCQGKTPAQIIAIAQAMMQAGQNVLLTRLYRSDIDDVAAGFNGARLDRCDSARMLHLRVTDVPRKSGTVGVLCAGTTDIPVAEEAAMTADALGSRVERLYDVGVAGLHRLLRHRETIESARVLIVVAGMEGALPSVVAGLARAPVIAVPTSVGYGAAFGGVTALLGMLTTCAPGVSVVNIDNGFGAGYLADVINGIGEVAGSQG